MQHSFVRKYTESPQASIDIVAALVARGKAHVRQIDYDELMQALSDITVIDVFPRVRCAVDRCLM